jgi:phytanoyl-CoA hydroxylase
MGLKKKYFSPISSRDFRNLSSAALQTENTEKDRLKDTYLFQILSTEEQESLNSFWDQGYAVIRNYFNTDQVDRINRESGELLKKKKLRLNKQHKIMFAIHASQMFSDLGNDPKLKELLSVLLGGEAQLFQSINFLHGSEQATHSDSIHMTTYPLGGLLGVWIALEDISMENGPLHYFPASHKLPYYLNHDYDNEGTRFLLGKKSYSEYEQLIENKTRENGLEKKIFLAGKGDLLIWHANLFHGGEPHTDKSRTRKSMVLHYFRKDAVCYHEISQRPALFRLD